MRKTIPYVTVILSVFASFIGVTVKFWNIYLKNDGLEENHERLEVVLKAQKNVVLGARSRASVEIVDPRHGIIPSACTFFTKIAWKMSNVNFVLIHTRCT